MFDIGCVPGIREKSGHPAPLLLCALPDCHCLFVGRGCGYDIRRCNVLPDSSAGVASQVLYPASFSYWQYLPQCLKVLNVSLHTISLQGRECEFAQRSS